MTFMSQKYNAFATVSIYRMVINGKFIYRFQTAKNYVETQLE